MPVSRTLARLGSHRGTSRAAEDTFLLPALRSASELPRGSTPTAVTREDAKSTESSEAGQPWASGQLVFKAGSFESGPVCFADDAGDSESAKEFPA